MNRSSCRVSCANQAAARPRPILNQIPARNSFNPPKSPHRPPSSYVRVGKPLIGRFANVRTITRLDHRFRIFAQGKPDDESEDEEEFALIGEDVDEDEDEIEAAGIPLISSKDSESGDNEEDDEFGIVQDLEDEDFEVPESELMALEETVELDEEYDDVEDEESDRESQSSFESEEDPESDKYPHPPPREFELADLLEIAGYGAYAEPIRQQFEDGYKVSGVQSNWEKVRPGDIFFAETTEEFDNTGYIQDALDNGAAAIVVTPRSEDDAEGGVGFYEVPLIGVPDMQDAMGAIGCAFYDHPSGKMETVVGVTGSAGKTTVAWLIRSILCAHGRLTGYIGDIEDALDDDHLDPDVGLWRADKPDSTKDQEHSVPYHVLKYEGRYYKEETIPDALRVQKLLGAMADRGASACVIECPSGAMSLGRLHYIQYTLAVFTNLYEEAPSSFPSFEEYKKAKGRFFKGLDDPKNQRAIINIDDPHAQDFTSYSSKVPVVTYSLSSPDADVYAENVKYTIWETEVIIHTPVGRLQIITPLFGEINLYNVLAAAAAAISINVPLATIVEGIETVDQVPGRSEIIDAGQQPDFSVVIDNAHTPKRLARLMDNVRSCGVKRIFLVFGCPGNERESDRAGMGEVAHFKADYVIFTNNSPRFEEPNAIINDIIAGLPEEVRERYSLWVMSPWQDTIRTPWWFEEWVHEAQKEMHRYVMEDRYLAIRAAIGTVQEGDVIVLAGRGEREYQEIRSVDGEDLIKSWFDDRMEVLDAINRLPFLQQTNLDRKDLPWLRKSASRAI